MPHDAATIALRVIELLGVGMFLFAEWNLWLLRREPCDVRCGPRRMTLRQIVASYLEG